jgi:hypothetical protein
MGGASVTIPDKTMLWERTTGCAVRDLCGSNETEKLDPGKPIVLLKNRACGKDADGQDTVTDTPTSGYMIWMRPD